VRSSRPDAFVFLGVGEREADDELDESELLELPLDELPELELLLERERRFGFSTIIYFYFPINVFNYFWLMQKFLIMIIRNF
jgi:hypothetical protein